MFGLPWSVCVNIFPSDTGSSSTRLGKVRHNFLPLEYKLTQLVENIVHQPPTWGTETPACEWPGVQCDAHETITRIFWTSLGLAGPLCWDHLPDTLVYIDTWSNKLCGTVPWARLPEGLETLSLVSNEFIGVVDLSALPSSLMVLNLAGNQFNGKVEFSSLPFSLDFLNLDENSALEGEADVANCLRRVAYTWKNTGITVI